MSDKKVCSICHQEYKGWGNNAEPVNSGLWCDSCNYGVVISARLQEMMLNKKGEEK